MQVKALVALFTVFIETTLARRCSPFPSPGFMPILGNIPSECSLQRQCHDQVSPSAIVLDCGYDRPMCFEELMSPPILECGPMSCDGVMSPPILECGCTKPRRNKELVLPPLRAELPKGLGYFPSAVPLVASFFSPAVEVGVCAGASIPVTSPCSCLTLAAPVCPDIAPLVRSVIL